MKTSGTALLSFLRRVVPFVVVVVLLVIGWAPTAQAQATWTNGAADGNWTNPANWMSGIQPGAGQNIAFISGTYSISSNIPNTITYGQIDVNITGTITFNQSGGILRTTRWNLTGGSATFAAGMTLQLESGPSSNFNNTTTIAGKVIIQTGVSATVSASSFLVIQNGGELEIQGSAAIIGSTPTYDTGAKLTYTGSTAKTIDIEFPNTISNLTVTFNNTAGVTVGSSRTVGVGSLAIVKDGSTLTLNAALTLSGGGGGKKIQIEGIPIINGTNNIGYGGPLDTLEYTGTGTYTLGKEIPATGIMPGAILLNKTSGGVTGVQGVLNADGGFFVKQGTWTIPAVAGGARLNMSSSAVTYSIGTGASLTLQAGTSTSPPGGTLAVSTGRILTNNGTLNVNNWTRLEINGTGLINGANPCTYTSNAELRYSGSAGKTTTPQELPATMPGGVRFDNTNTITLGSSTSVFGAVTIATGTVLTGGNTLQINTAGETVAGSTLTVQSGGTLTIDNTTPFANNGTLSVQGGGTLRLNNLGRIVGNNSVAYIAGSTLLYTGGSDRTATPQEFPSSLTGNLHIDKIAGSAVELSAPRTLNGGASALRLTSGLIRTVTTGGISTLTLASTASNAIDGGSASSYIDGPFARALPTPISVDGTTVNFPIGQGSNYRPINLKDIRTSAGATVRMWAVSNATAATFTAPLTGITGTDVWQAALVGGGASVFTATKIEITSSSVSASSIVATTVASVSGTYQAGFGATTSTVVGTTVSTPIQSSNNVSLPALPQATYMAIGTYVQPTTFYYFPNPPNNAASLQCWWSNPGGSAAGGLNPFNFITPGNSFIVTTGTKAFLTSPMTLGSGVNLTVQPSAAFSVAPTGLLTNNGITTIQGQGRLEIGSSPAQVLGNAVVYSSTTAILWYFGTGPITPTAQELPAAMPGSVRFGDGTGSPVVTLSGSTVVAGFVTNETLSTLNTGANTLQIALGGVNRGSIEVGAGGVLAVSDGAQFRYTMGATGFNIGGGGTLRLDGTGLIDGAQVVSYSGGTLLYTGASNRVATPQEFPEFSNIMTGNLIIDKTAGTTVELQSARTMGISANLTLTTGTIRTATTAGISLLTLLNPSPTAIQGGSPASYVDGPLARRLNNGDYTFPVGTAGRYMPVRAFDVLAATTRILVQAFTSATTGTAGVGVQTLSGTEYWKVSKLSGSSPTSSRLAFHDPTSIQPTNILATTTSTLPLAPLVALPTVYDATSFAGASPYLQTATALSGSTLFALSDDAYFAIGVAPAPPALAGFGSAVQLNGTNQYGVVTSGYTPTAGDFTLEALVKPESLTASHPIVSKLDCINGGYDLALAASGRVVFTIFSSCTAVDIDTLLSQDVLPVNRWSHIAITRNSLTNEYTLFINGIPNARKTTSRAPGAATSPLFIGSRIGTSAFFAGSIDEVRIWNANLSTLDFPSEGAIPRYRGIELSSTHPRAASLAGYWKFNTLSTTSTNSAGAGIPATLIGSPGIVQSSTFCSIVAQTSTPVSWQLPGTKVGGVVTFATIGANGGSTLGTVSVSSSGLAQYTPLSPITTTNAYDFFLYRVSDGLGSVSTASVFVHFAPASGVLPSPQIAEAGVPFLLPVQQGFTQGGIEPFSVTHSFQNQPYPRLVQSSVVQPTGGTLSTLFTVSTNAALTLTRNVTDVYGLGVFPTIAITPRFTPVTLAFSTVSSTGTLGLGTPPNARIFVSDTAKSVTVGVWNPGGLAATVSTGTLRVSVAALGGGTAQFSIQNSTATFSTVPPFQSVQTLDSVRIRWTNSPLEGGTTAATLTASLTGTPGVASTSLTITINANPRVPAITGFTPIGGNVGTTVTISGVNFGAVSSIRFGAVNATTFTRNSDTQLTAVAPPGAVSAPITFVPTVGVSTTSSVSFLIVPPPVIDPIGVEPAIGSTGTVVVINGLNFVGPVKVFFGDSIASGVTVVSPTELRAVVGNGMTGKVRVETLGGATISALTFNYIPFPKITNFSPADASKGSIVTVLGADFTVIDSVFVGGWRVPTFTVLPPNQIQFRLDSAVSGVIRIFTPAGSTSASAALRVLAPPVISSVTPTTGGAGTVITITGENFVSVSTLTISGVTLADITVVSPTQITARLGGVQQSTSSAVSLTTPAGTAVSKDFLQILAPPTIVNFTPRAAGAGAFITITGTDFPSSPLPVVRIGGLTANVTVISRAELLVQLPLTLPAAMVLVPSMISVTTVSGSTEATQTFIIAPPPLLTDVNPKRGGAGSVITISGRNFYNVTRVAFGGVTAANFSVESPTELRAQVSNDGASGDVSVFTAQGVAVSTATFEFLPNSGIPIISGVTPSAAFEGEEVEIRGANFSNASEVKFGGVAALRFRVESATRIFATVGKGTSGTVQITTNLGTGTALQRFRHLGKVIITVLTPLQRDSSALAELYLRANGGSWNRQAGWLVANAPITSWAGVKVENERVIGLNLSGNNLEGSIPAVLEQLSELQDLDLSFNALTGTVPPFLTMFPKLRTLKLNNNTLNGLFPRVFQTSATLQVLHLQTNNLTGTVTAAVCQLVNLQDLQMQNNSLEGVLPACLGEMRSLVVLNMSRNRFVGTIPAALGELQNLQELSLAENQLTGSLPETFGIRTRILADKGTGNAVTATPRLKLLDVSNNQLSGSLPANLGTLTSLQSLLLAGNRFTGSLPSTLENLSQLTTLDVSSNQLSGAIPPSIWGGFRSLTTASLRANQFTGTLPDALGRATNLQTVWLDSNALTGMTDSLARLTNLRRLSLAGNRFTSLPRLPTLDSLNVALNRLSFERIEFLPRTVRAFVYAPQDSILQRVDTLIRVFTPFTMRSGVGGTQNEYQWYKNGRVLQGRTDSVLAIERTVRADTGEYTCFVRNRLAPALTLVRRSVVLRGLPPEAPTQTPTLLSPQANGQSISRNPVFRWTTTAQTTAYNLEISTNATFSTALSITVNDALRPQFALQTLNGGQGANLDYLTVHFWRVRAVSEGLAGAWTPSQRFTTLPSGRTLNVESLDFGRVVLGRTSPVRLLRVENLSGVPLFVQSVSVEDERGQFQRVGIDEPVLLAADSVLLVPVQFQAKQQGYAESAVRVAFAPQSAATPQQVTFVGTLTARAGVLAFQADTIQLGAITAGSSRAASLAITNKSDGPVNITDVRFVPGDQTQTLGSFALIDPLLSTIVLKPNESTSIGVVCTVRADAPELGLLYGTATVIASGDTALVPFVAIVRRPNPNDVTIATVLLAEQQNAPPGSAVTLQLKVTVVRSRLDKGLDDLYRAAQPVFTGEIAFDRNVLVPLADETNLVPVGNRRSDTVRYTIPPTRFGYNERGQLDSVLLRLRCVAVAGRVETTPLRLVRFAWDTSSVGKEAIVVVETTATQQFTATASRAGGVRLITRTSGASGLLAISPNPVKEGAATVSYTVAEAGIITIVLTDAAGNIMKKLVDGVQAKGRHEVQLRGTDARTLPNGAYLLRMESLDGVSVQRVDVVR
jgi:Leucine-rich repeat (LRR) protein